MIEIILNINIDNDDADTDDDEKELIFSCFSSLSCLIKIDEDEDDGG